MYTKVAVPIAPLVAGASRVLGALGTAGSIAGALTPETPTSLTSKKPALSLTNKTSGMHPLMAGAGGLALGTALGGGLGAALGNPEMGGVLGGASGAYVAAAKAQEEADKIQQAKWDMLLANKMATVALRHNILHG